MIHVVAAAVTAADGRMLIAQRPPGKHLAGGWEFPGGKLEPGESRTDGLARELREELGIVIRRPRPLIRVQHSYPYGDVLIDMWVVTRYDGEPRGLDGQALRWLTQEELERAELLPADQPIVRALRLPERLTGARSDFYAPLKGVISESPGDAHAAAAAGADFIAMNQALPEVALARLCASLCIPLYARGVAVDAAWEAGATGLNELGS